MRIDVSQILKNAGDQLVKELRKQLKTFRKLPGYSKSIKNEASGKTGRSIRFEVSENAKYTVLRIYAPIHVNQIISGRGENKKKTGRLLQNIKKWIRDKGLDLNPYAVTNVLANNGSVLRRNNSKYPKPYVPNFISDTIKSYSFTDLRKKLKNNIIAGAKGLKK